MFQIYLDWFVILTVYCNCANELLDVSELTYLGESILHRLYKKVGNGTQIIHDIETYYHGLNEVLDEVENKTLAGITLYEELQRTFGPPHTHITYDSYDYKKAYNFTSEEAEHVDRIMDDTKKLWWLIEMKFATMKLTVQYIRDFGQSIYERLDNQLGNGTITMKDMERYYTYLKQILIEVEENSELGKQLYLEIMRTSGPPHTKVGFISYEIQKKYNWTWEDAGIVQKMLKDTRKLWWYVKREAYKRSYGPFGGSTTPSGTMLGTVPIFKYF